MINRKFAIKAKKPVAVAIVLGISIYGAYLTGENFIRAPLSWLFATCDSPTRQMNIRVLVHNGDERYEKTITVSKEPRKKEATPSQHRINVWLTPHTVLLVAHDFEHGWKETFFSPLARYIEGYFVDIIPWQESPVKLSLTPNEEWHLSILAPGTVQRRNVSWNVSYSGHSWSCQTISIQPDQVFDFIPRMPLHHSPEFAKFLSFRHVKPVNNDKDSFSMDFRRIKSQPEKEPSVPLKEKPGIAYLYYRGNIDTYDQIDVSPQNSSIFE